jgi:hypothetical protein
MPLMKKKGPKCLHYKKLGHLRRECDDFKAWLAKKGNNFISFIDEAFFTIFPSNSNATVHVTNLSQGFLGTRTTVNVEVVGTLPLLLYGGFTLTLNSVLYVLSLRRNLISVSSLEDDGYECLFENNKCTIKVNDVIVGLAPRRGTLYILSLNNFPVMNMYDVTNKRRRISTSDNETSSKLWHCRLCHILRG